jgi:hypothetical protein
MVGERVWVMREGKMFGLSGASTGFETRRPAPGRGPRLAETTGNEFGQIDSNRIAALRARSAKAWCGWHGTRVGRRRSAPRQLVSKPIARLPRATNCAKALAPAGGAQESRIDAPLVSKPVRGMFAEMESGTRLETANESGRLWRAHSFTAEGEPGQDVNNQGQDGQRT